MLTRTRLGWSIDNATPARWAASAAAAKRLHGPDGADGRRRGVRHLLQRTAPHPLGDHQATVTGVDHVEHPGDTGLVDAAEPQGAGQDLLQHVVGQRPVGVDEGQRHLPVQGGVQRLPELQGRRAAVEDQQSIAAAGDASAGNQMDVVSCRVPPAVAGRIERGRPAPRFGRDVAVALVGRARRRRLGLAVGGDVGLEVVGDRSWQLGTRRGALDRAVGHLRSFR